MMVKRCRFPVRVRWLDCDPLGVVFFTKYLEWFDVIGVFELLRNAGITVDGKGEIKLDGEYTGASMVIKNVSCEYFSPAYFDDELEIEARCKKIGNKSISFELYLLKGDEKLAKAEFTFVFINPELKTSIEIPENIRERLKTFLRNNNRSS